MRLRKKKTKIEDSLDETPEDEIVFQKVFRRNRVQLGQQLLARTNEENELIRRHLGVDDKGRCLRHPNQHITGKVDNHRFESIHICLICDSEIQAGGLRQRKSMKNVIDSLNELQGDKAGWRKKTNILYHGQAYDPIAEEEEEAEAAEADNNNTRNNDTHSVKSDNSSENGLTHMLEFFDKAEEEKIKKSKKHKKMQDDDEDDTENDAGWKQEVALRVAHVRAWDDKMALSQNPTYAKYFRMMNVGIPLDAIRQSIDLDGLDNRIIDLDPNRPLQDQVDAIPDITEFEKAEIRKSDRLAFLSSNDDDDDNDEPTQPMNIMQTVDVIHQAYVRRKDALHELEDEMDPKKQTFKHRVLKSLFQKPPQKKKVAKSLVADEKDDAPTTAKTTKVKQTVQPPSNTIAANDDEPKRESKVQFTKHDDNKKNVMEEEKVVEESANVPPASSEAALPQETKPATPKEAAAVMYYSATPANPLPIFEPKTSTRKRPKKPYKSLTKIGTVKYSIARTNEDLEDAKQELAQRQVITASLLTQVQALEAQLKEKDEMVEQLQHDLYDLDPDDPLVPRINGREEDDEERAGVLPEVDRSDVVKKRLSKLSLAPASLRLL